MDDENKLTLSGRLDNHSTAILQYLSAQDFSDALKDIDAAIKAMEDNVEERKSWGIIFSYWRVIALDKLDRSDEAEEELEVFREFRKNHRGKYSFLRPPMLTSRTK